MPNINAAQAAAVAGRTVNANSVPDINALLGGVVDRKKWYWYDTFKAVPGYQTIAGEYNFFTSAVGQLDLYNNNIAKTLLETNLTGQGTQFASPYDMVLTNLMFKFSEDMLLYDIIQLVKYGYFKFSILEKTFFKGHLWRHPAGAGFSGFSTKQNESVWNNGVPDPGCIYYFGQWSKYIPPLTTFGLTLQFFESVGLAASGSATAAAANFPAIATFYNQSPANLPTFATAAQGGNGVWLIAGMNGLSDGPVA